MTLRFWIAASVGLAPGGFCILLDGKPMKLPSGAVLTVAGAPLAEAIAAEWQDAGGAQGSSFGPHQVPLTGLAGSAQERVTPNRAGMIDSLLRYADADALCYRAETPANLAAAQAAAWQPWLDWARHRFGARLHVTTAIRHIAQPAASLAALRATLEKRGDAEIAALGLAIPAMGSCVLGLALAERAITPAAALQVASLDELYQQAQWGADEEASDRRARLGRDIELAARFMELCGCHNDRRGPAA